jgi:hypothetical protein
MGILEASVACNRPALAMAWEIGRKNVMVWR